MRWTKNGLGALLIGMTWLIPVPLANAQRLGTSRSLGGYGASSGGSVAAMTAGSPMVPYAGNFGGFMPYRMGSSTSLSFSSRGTSAMGPTRPPFSLSPITGGMTSMSGGMGQGFGERTRAFSSLGSQSGMGLDGRMRQQMPGAAGMSVVPPNFGYPFQQPPSLLGPSSSDTGMSM
jgi:hypothetical protein